MSARKQYDAQYFLDFFSEIPAKKWIKGDLQSEEDKSCRCALGHLGVKPKKDGEWFLSARTEKKVFALAKVLSGYDYLDISDAFSTVYVKNDEGTQSAKTNILSALKAAKKRT